MDAGLRKRVQVSKTVRVREHPGRFFALHRSYFMTMRFGWRRPPGNRGLARKAALLEVCGKSNNRVFVMLSAERPATLMPCTMNLRPRSVFDNPRRKS
jgi:hypothetical protein